MANIKITVEGPLMDGHRITFKAPCNCDVVEKLDVRYMENNTQKSKLFTMRDTQGNDLTGLGNLFFGGTYVDVVLDPNSGTAYLQNANTNGYLEWKIDDSSRLPVLDSSSIKNNSKSCPRGEFVDYYFYEATEDTKISVMASINISSLKNYNGLVSMTLMGSNETDGYVNKIVNMNPYTGGVGTMMLNLNHTFMAKAGGTYRIRVSQIMKNSTDANPTTLDCQLVSNVEWSNL